MISVQTIFIVLYMSEKTISYWNCHYLPFVNKMVEDVCKGGGEGVGRVGGGEKRYAVGVFISMEA